MLHLPSASEESFVLVNKCNMGQYIHMGNRSIEKHLLQYEYLSITLPSVDSLVLRDLKILSRFSRKVGNEQCDQWDTNVTRRKEELTECLWVFVSVVGYPFL